MKNTKIIKVEEENIDRYSIGNGAKIIQNGGLVVFPTETVYGLGANGLDEDAVKGIFAAKNRPADNPLILHISSISQVDELVKEIPEIGKLCMEKFWPGPLTILLSKSDKVPDIITAGLDTVAIRMPKNKIALELIRQSNTPIAAPSANISGRPSPTNFNHVAEDMMGKVDLIIDGGNTGIGLESTVLDLSTETPMILRPGGVTKEDLEKIIPNIRLDFAIIKEDEKIIPKSPGQKYRHYAPKAEMILIDGEVHNIVMKIKDESEKRIAKNQRVGIICTDETKDLYSYGIIKSMGSREKRETIAHNLFQVLRSFDNDELDIILAEGIDKSHIGRAIMNRLIKAADGNIIRV